METVQDELDRISERPLAALLWWGGIALCAWTWWGLLPAFIGGAVYYCPMPLPRFTFVQWLIGWWVIVPTYALLVLGAWLAG